MKPSEFDELVRRALECIPRLFRDAMQNLEIVVEDWPDPDLMAKVAGNSNATLYGLFIGKPLPARRFDDLADLPAVIRLYQGPLEADFPNPDDLAREVEITLVHEIAHFMGFDEETLEKYGYS
ncbi:MAG: metallopeptidase family protein [Candidatus Binatia bacterium]